MGSDESHFNISLFQLWGTSHKSVSTDHNFWRERTAEADSNRSPSAYQPNALPLGQTGSPYWKLSSNCFVLVSWGKRDGGGAGCQCPCRGSLLWTQWQLTAIGYLGPGRASIVTEMEWELRQLVPLCSVQVFRQFLSLPPAPPHPPPPPVLTVWSHIYFRTNVIHMIMIMIQWV